MKQPIQKDSTLLADILLHEKEGTDMAAWWLGQSGFLLQYGGKRLLFDPYLSDSLTKKYDGTSKPHVRISEGVVAPGELPRIDVATSSHNHTDHLDAETLLPIFEKNPAIRFIAPEANRAFVAQRLGCPADWPIGLRDGQSIEVEGMRFHGIAAAHNTVERDAAGCPRCMGLVVEWAGRAVYHSGDTLLFEEMEAVLSQFSIDIAFLPINGNLPERGVAGNLDGIEAARLAKKIGARLVVPCHFDLFEFNTADPVFFEEECRRIGQPFRTLRLGERLDLPD